MPHCQCPCQNQCPCLKGRALRVEAGAEPAPSDLLGRKAGIPAGLLLVMTMRGHPHPESVVVRPKGANHKGVPLRLLLPSLPLPALWQLSVER